MLSFLFAHLARILAHGVAVRGKTFELEFNQTYAALARELRVSQSAGAAAPPSCGRGLCVGALSSDFELRRANTSTPPTFSSGDVFVRQNTLYCERRLLSSGEAPECAPYLRQLSQLTRVY